jgi:hypothetical protein
MGPRRKRNTGIARLVLCGLATLGLGVGCTEKGRSLVLVDLSSTLALDHVSVVVTQSSQHLGEVEAQWAVPPQPLELGVYLPKTVTGTVDVVACGFDATGAVIGSSPMDPGSVTAAVQPGAATVHIPITLASGTPPALCASIGGAGGSGGGNGGNSGRAGSPGTGGGSGGAAGTGAGGASGGTGGAVGVGGASGSGVAGHGQGGTIGSGGAAGGAGGAGGSAGKGAGGSAGSATGGAGGSAGGPAPLWGVATSVGGVSASSERLPSVAVDPSGNAVVIYTNGADIWFTRYDAVNGWGTATQLASQGGNQAQQQVIGVDKNGNYLAVWAQDPNGPIHGIYASTSTNGATWSGVSTITATIATDPVLSVNASGAAVVAWTQTIQGNGSNTNQAVASIGATTGTTWSAPQIMRAGAAGDDSDRNPAVAMSGLGRAFVGWEQGDGTTGASGNYINLWMRQYTAATGWNAAGLFEHNNTGAYGISIAANTAGNAVASYIEVTSAGSIQLWSQRASTTGVFAAPLEIAAGSEINIIVPPSVALDESGFATVAWAFGIGATPTYQVYTNRAGPNDAGWPVAMEMETDDLATDDSTNLGGVTDPIVRNDAAGNVTLIWRKRTSGTRFDLESRRFTAGAWGPATLLETLNTDSVSWPALGVGTSGTAVAAWEYDPAEEIAANVFR